MRLITRDHKNFRDPLSTEFNFIMILNSEILLYCGESSIGKLFDVCFNTIADEGDEGEYVAWTVHRP